MSSSTLNGAINSSSTESNWQYAVFAAGFAMLLLAGGTAVVQSILWLKSAIWPAVSLDAALGWAGLPTLGNFETEWLGMQLAVRGLGTSALSLATLGLSGVLIVCAIVPRLPAYIIACWLLYTWGTLLF